MLTPEKSLLAVSSVPLSFVLLCFIFPSLFFPICLFFSTRLATAQLVKKNIVGSIPDAGHFVCREVRPERAGEWDSAG